MKFPYLLFMVAVMAFSIGGRAQQRDMDIEHSSEVFLEEYSDTFQENFFEALKQKGIENYDKAINLLLECKLIDADNAVVDHELAKVYLIEKQYAAAQDYAIAALLSDPENYWFLNTLVSAIRMQGSSLDQMDIGIPMENDKLQENLAVIYFKEREYEKSLIVLSGIKTSEFTERLKGKIKDSLKGNEERTTKKKEVIVTEEPTDDPIAAIKVELGDLMARKDYVGLAKRSEEALENFPAQPYFYYINGLALNKMGKHEEAIEVLEGALDYMLDDVPLQNNIYQELVNAHTGLNNSSKANMYLRMIKPGF